MHAAFFSFKRAHHSVLRIGRPLLAQVGLTAARFDMLFAIKTFRNRRIPQGTLRRTLGVGRTTVGRMLASLEELKLVKRTVDPRDRRRKIVELTSQGRWRIARAYRQLVGSGWAQLALESALGVHEDSCLWCRKEQVDKVACELQKRLLDIRDGFRDSADLEYPWVEPDLHGPMAAIEEFLMDEDVDAAADVSSPG